MLTIKKHPLLLHRFPELRARSALLQRMGKTIIYGAQLNDAVLVQLECHLQISLTPLTVWQVGKYDVVMLADELTPELQTACWAYHIDCASTFDLPDLSQPGLLVMDMDSTAIQIECIDEIAKLAGVGEAVSLVTEQAMQGLLDFEQSLRERVRALKGADENILSQVLSTLPLMSGLTELVAELQARGWKVAIASGGFTYFADHLKSELNLVAAYANQLEIKDGKLTGEVLGEVISAETKAQLLYKLAEQYDIESHNIVAIGDGANDLPMIEAAGLGVAFHAKPKVTEQASIAIQHADLTGLLCVLSASLIPQRKLTW